MDDLFRASDLHSSLSKSPSGASRVSPGSNKSGNEPPDRPPKKTRRGFLTQNACTRCRQKKSKCDGRRPVCGRCERYGAECAYDIAEEGVTRMQNLQRQLDHRNEDYGRLQSFVRALQSGTDQEAAELLALLRLEEPVDQLLLNPIMMCMTQRNAQQWVAPPFPPDRPSMGPQQASWTFVSQRQPCLSRSPLTEGDLSRLPQRLEQGGMPSPPETRPRPVNVQGYAPQRQMMQSESSPAPWANYPPDAVAPTYIPQVASSSQTMPRGRQPSASGSVEYAAMKRSPP